jgi:hypothetical protein
MLQSSFVPEITTTCLSPPDPTIVVPGWSGENKSLYGRMLYDIVKLRRMIAMRSDQVIRGCGQ